MLRSEEDIQKKLDLITDLEFVIHPSVKLFLEWVLMKGNEKDQTFLFKLLESTAKGLKEIRKDNYQSIN